MRFPSVREWGAFQDRNRLALVLAVILVVYVFCVIGLHFGQKAHNKLDLDLEHLYAAQESYVPGELIATALVKIMERELNGVFGWRPNDFFLWGPWLWADNNAHRQLGIIRAVRETTRVFRDNLTKVAAEVYDPNLLNAETMFRNDPTRWILPSAESKFKKGVEFLKKYIDGLKTDPPVSKPLNKRNIELIRLFEAWCDVLGDAHALLYREHEADGSPVSMRNTDDYFYEAQGTTHVMYYVLEAVSLEYGEGLRPTVRSLVEDVLEALHTAATLKPIVVLDGCMSCLRANHRSNLDGLIAEAWTKMVLIRDELEK